MFLSLLVGVIVYMVAQFFWYAPFAFGPLWTRLSKDVPSSSIVPIALPAFMGPSMRNILFPAVIVSFELHVLRVVVSGLSTESFLCIIIGLWLSVVAGKYLRKSVEETQRRKWHIEDGALLWSLLWVAEVVILWWGNFR